MLLPFRPIQYYRRGLLSRASQVALYKSELQDAAGAEPSYDHPLDGEAAVDWAKSIDRSLRSSHGTVTEWDANLACGYIRPISGPENRSTRGLNITPATAGDALFFRGRSFVPTPPNISTALSDSKLGGRLVLGACLSAE
eukprot:COSAG03_NODE_5664_length_1199_cov_0.800909_1_plen_139_part_10